MLKLILSVFLATSLTSSLFGATRSELKQYKVDWKPLQKYPRMYDEYHQIYQASKDRQSIDEMARALNLVERVLEKEEQWLDGYWLVGSIAFQLGSSYTHEKDLPVAREIFVKGRHATEQCLKRDPSHVLCKLFLGSSLGKIGTIDGIFASLKKARKIQDLWTDVAESDVDYRFMESVTMQGSVNYALGIFYRLIPDMLILDWLFDVRGDIDKSIRYHRQSIAYDGPNACNVLMLSVSLLCKADGDFKNSEGREGLKLLSQVESIKTEHATLRVCVKDAGKLKAKPSLSCGYDTSKQQDTSQDAFEKSQDSEPVAH
ncbi:hypothetical protein [Pseudobacteriovorax antillogorgiicola]|uniref:Uncharacterized protein n=1 Tax=Pseudobacteriovorax antillogorgiicola TaxID=1513793 RepID=A0A1Y6CIH7_9BACT|nr:hypothetical protein [Pseudobacteriovorax antillogorgiicola]TCS46337.1 hypothetical protein EDD56_1241 [Pseudobacteriovorax antillogorgiicola]SMF67989.1 hypothetical protein SAMN06296036_1241 [Pseudobacteriovorax antillogorgiicola]